MKTNLLSGFALLIMVLVSCKNDTKPSATPVTPEAQKTDNRPIVWLEALYSSSASDATSVDQLFDEDPGTGWQTSLGVGGEEGIMIQFQQPTEIGQVKLEPTDALINAEMIAYVNGKPGTKQSTTAPIVVKTACKTLYIRFIPSKSGSKEAQVSLKPSTIVTDEGVQVGNFAKDQRFGIKQLEVLDASGQALRLRAPNRIQGTLTASSTLLPQSAYGADQLCDGRKEFVWVEGAEDLGIGQEIHLTFPSAQTITSVRIWNGYQRSPEHYKANARLKDFEFGADGGLMHTYTLRDDAASQKIDLSAAAKGTHFDLHIKSAYPGQKYKDLAISELLFFNGEIPFTITQEKAKVTSAAVLDPMLNRLFVNSKSPMEGAEQNQSFILRTDGTFVYYQDEIYSDGTTIRIVADGNWELLKSSEGMAQVKVFGKWFNASKLTDFYNKVQNTQVSQIFSDELTITNQKIEGKSKIPAIYLQ